MSCNSMPAEEKKWIDLFNGRDLSGWDTYLGPEYDPVQKRFAGEPIGLNNDPCNVFDVVTTDHQPAIRISGQHFGGMSTQKEYENYHLHLEFKWGLLQWSPKENANRDSGLLYHGIEDHGAHHPFWLMSQECQIQEGDCGDYWGIGDVLFDIPVSVESAFKVFSKSGVIKTFGIHTDQGRHCVKFPDAEHPTGQWNSIDLYSFEDTSVHVVNGTANMILYNSRYFDGSRETPLTKGKFELQSEGAEVFYRNIRVRPISSLPDSLL